MIEKVLTPNSVVKQKYARMGVVTFIRSLDGKILLLKEKIAREVTGKNVGDVSVLCETSEEGESWGETLVRGIKEELNIDYSDQPKMFGIDKTNGYMGETEFVEGVLARVAYVHFLGSQDSFVSGTDLGEVEVQGWEEPGKLFDYPLRKGVRNVLNNIDINFLNENITTVLFPLSLAYLQMVDAGNNYQE